MSELAEVDISALKSRYGLETFIETGCHNGSGLRSASAAGFLRRYSCDIDPLAVERCEQYATAVYQLASVAFLESLIELVGDEPTLFWLDAHFPEDYGQTSTRFPLPEELLVLSRKRNIERDVVLCDDMRVIKDPDNPTFDPTLSRWHVDLKLSDLTSVLPLHSEILNIGTGILLLRPQ